MENGSLIKERKKRCIAGNAAIAVIHLKRKHRQRLVHPVNKNASF
jgi:hypothetical protein